LHVRRWGLSQSIPLSVCFLSYALAFTKLRDCEQKENSSQHLNTSLARDWHCSSLASASF
jgi:hypothetical protein